MPQIVKDAAPGSTNQASSVVLLLLLPPLFWAGNAVVGRLAVNLVPAVTLNFLRWLIAFLLLAPFAAGALWRQRHVALAHRRTLFGLALFGVASYNSFQYLALTTSSPITTSLIGASGPVFILLVGRLAFEESVTRRQLLGALISVLGVVWVMVRGEPNRVFRIEFVTGDLFMLTATLTWSIYTWILRRHRPPMTAAPLLLVQIVFGLLVLGPFAALEHATRTPVWSVRTAWILGYVAVLPSLVGYFFWDRGVAKAGAQLPIFFQNLTPIFAAAISVVVLGELPRAFHVVGLVFIVAGIWLASPPRRSLA